MLPFPNDLSLSLSPSLSLPPFLPPPPPSLLSHLFTKHKLCFFSQEMRVCIARDNPPTLQVTERAKHGRAILGGEGEGREKGGEERERGREELPEAMFHGGNPHVVLLCPAEVSYGRRVHW